MEIKYFLDDFTDRVIKYLEEKDKQKSRRSRVKPIETEQGFYCDGCNTSDRGETMQCIECRVWNCAYCTTWCEECGNTVCCDESKYCDECGRNLCDVCNCECVCNKSKP